MRAAAQAGGGGTMKMGNPVDGPLAAGQPPQRRDGSPGERSPGPADLLRERDEKTSVLERPEAQRPNMYKILMLNDDYTPMEFVVHVLRRFFGMTEERAVTVMLQVHNEGKALIGVFSYDVAETKVALVTAFARKHQHPLRCALETE